MAFACLVAFQKKRLRVYGKGAQQLATLGLIFGWVLLIVVRVWLYYFPDRLIEYCWLGMVGAVLLQCLHFSCWNTLLKSHFVFQKWFVFLNALIAAATAIPSIFLIKKQIYALFSSGMNAWGVLHHFLALDFVKENISYFYSASVVISILVALSAPAAWSAIALPAFKKFQDFGRDHYRTLLGWATHWARNTWLCVWIAQCLLVLTGTWYLWHEGNASIFDISFIAGTQILWLFPVILWTVAYKSNHPLRHKLGLLVALLVSIAFF